MATSTLGLNQFTKGGQTSLLNSYNADMLKIDNGIAADRARLTAAEQAIADLPTGGLDMSKVRFLTGKHYLKYESTDGNANLGNNVHIVKVGLIFAYSTDTSFSSGDSSAKYNLQDYNRNRLTSFDIVIPRGTYSAGDMLEFDVDYTTPSDVPTPINAYLSGLSSTQQNEKAYHYAIIG